jgi:phytoene synthase
MTPDEYCAQKAARPGSALYYSLRFLAPEKRRAATAIYAFVRETQEAVRDCSDLDVARARLAWWRMETMQAFEGKPQHPVTQALAQVATHYAFPQEAFQAIIDGVESELLAAGFPDFKALQRYCHRVGSTPAVLAAEVYGYRDPRTLKFAHDLGFALQLTGLVLDVGVAVRRGRLTLPEDELAVHGISIRELASPPPAKAGVGQFLSRQIERCDQLYTQALGELPLVDRRAQRPALALAAIGRALLDEIRGDPAQVLTALIDLTPLKKFWIAWRTWNFG